MPLLSALLYKVIKACAWALHLREMESLAMCYQGAYEKTTATARSSRSRLVKQQLCTCITLFLYISLPSLHDYDVKVPKFHVLCRT